MNLQAARAAAQALESRSSIVLVHVAAARGMPDQPLGLRAVLHPDHGLRGSLGAEGLDLRVAADAADALTAAAPAVHNYGPDGADASRRDPVYLRVFFDPIVPAPRLLVVGAGHIARPLVEYAMTLGFETTVIDDRADYANRDWFPAAHQIVAKPFREALAQIPIDAATYIVLVTRAHRFDEDALRLMLGSPAPYIGMIGSRRRVHIVHRTLLDEGFPPAAFRRVFAPIGLDIGAETPEEIALAIAAELVVIRRGGRGAHLSLAALRSGAAETTPEPARRP